MVLLLIGAGMLVALSMRYGWPLFMVIPLYGALGTMLLFGRTALDKPRLAFFALGFLTLGVVLYFVA
jgi:hypothetical protein